jgi:hypothetical protein
MGAQAISHSDPTQAAARLAQRIDWLGFALCVPADWEIVRHSTNPERGVLAFVDRRQERLGVSWTACPKAPDLARLVEDFQRADGSEPCATPWQRSDGARGFASHGEQGPVVRAVRYDATQARLLELTLSARGLAAPEVLMHRLLDGLVASEPGHFALSAFGLCVSGPCELSLASASVRAMDARIGLSVGASSRVLLRRLGAADVWFSGDYRAWLAKNEPGVEELSYAATVISGHPGLATTGVERGPLLQRVLRRLPSSQSLVWLCPHDNALYLVSARLAPGSTFELASLRVACCGPRVTHA